MSRRRAAAAAIPFLLLVLWWVRPRAPDARDDGTPAVAHLPQAAAPILPSAPVLAEPPRADLPFAIAEISVEKSAVCRGEPTLIGVRPRHDVAAEARWLEPLIGDQRGWEVPYVDYRSPPGRYRIPVRLFAPPAAGSAPRPYVEGFAVVEIKDCQPEWVLMVDDRTLAEGNGESHELSAFLRAGSDFAPGGGEREARADLAASYLWDFGDGKSATSRERIVRHDFPAEEDRPADDGLEHTWLVRVTALDAGGRELATGLKAVNVRNAFAELKRVARRVQLKADYLAQGEGDSTPLALRNTDREETAVLARATAHLIDCENKEQGTREASPADFLEATVVPPRGRVSGRFTWPQTQGLCYVQVSLFGTSRPGGYEVVGYFSLTVGRSSLVVEVPGDRTALLNEAMRQLGNPKVLTLKDIRRLEDEGKLPRGALSQPAAPAR